MESGESLTTLKGHINPFCSLVINKEYQLNSGSEDGKIKVWNIETGECLETFDAHTWAVNSLIISKDARLISGSLDNKIKVWDVKGFKCLQIFNSTLATVKNNTLKVGTV
jgi:WD40 repeat protein